MMKRLHPPLRTLSLRFSLEILLYAIMPLGRTMTEKRVVIRKVNNEPEAHIIKGLLESENIPVVIKRDTFQKAIGAPLLSSKGTHILVPEKHVQSAETLLQSV
jgi:hypothetical protein